MEIGPDKTKVMINNPNGFQREIKIKGQRLEAVVNFMIRFSASVFRKLRQFMYLVISLLVLKAGCGI